MTREMDAVNNSVAAAAVASPFWLPALSDASQIAALLLPIAGLAWLLIQIWGYFHRKDKK